MKLALRVMFFLMLFSMNSMAKDIIKYSGFSGDGIESKYFTDLLELILEETSYTYGGYELQKIDTSMFQGRAIQQLKAKKIDVMWTMTSISRENLIEPIRIPVLKCLAGTRIFLIRKNEQSLFSNISSIEQLKLHYAGQGHDWPDAKILQYHGFNLVEATRYDVMATMLSKKRFDYFPRGLHEINHSLVLNNGLGIEQTLALSYIAPIFYFVDKNNTHLKKRLEIGLKALFDNGKFHQFFDRHPVTKNIKQRVKLDQRRIFSLHNPLLSSNTKQAVMPYCH